MSEKIYDTAIIGAGPAGLTVAIYCVRKTLSTILFEPKIPGGSLTLTNRIENFPGFEKISGMELGEKMLLQAQKLGVDFVPAKISEIKREESNCFVLSASNGNSYRSKSILLSTGASYRHLRAKGEKELFNRGVSFCATCDAPFFKGKKVAVIGGGDSAFTSARLIKDYASEVTIIHRRDEFRAQDRMLVEEVKKSGVKFLLNKEVIEIAGEKKVEKLILKDTKTGEQTSLPIDGVFINIGFEPENSLAKKSGAKISEAGYIEVDEGMRTNIAGIFAAGGVKQATVAVGQGAVASNSIYGYVKKG